MKFQFLINSPIEFILNLDKYLNLMVQNFGILTYIILFFVIFTETGFVVTPFLPGDSILFAAGAIASFGSINIVIVYLTFLSATILGDTVNYWIGYKVGPNVFKKDSRFIKREYLERTKRFYEKYGGKTIVLARFVPIIRTFAPFVAGIGIMSYKKFIIYNFLGGFLWTTLFVFGGFFFGDIPFVKNNFEIVVVAIIVISIIPIVFEIARSKSRKHQIS